MSVSREMNSPVWKQSEPNTKLKPCPRTIRQHRGIAGPVIYSPIVHCLDVRGEVADETRANEREQSHDHHRYERAGPFKTNKAASSPQWTHHIESSPTARAS